MAFLMVSVLVFLVELLARSTVLVVTYNGLLGESDLALYHSIEDAVTLLYSLFIFTKAVRRLYEQKVDYGNILTFDNLRWIKRLMTIGGIVILLWAVAIVLNLSSETFRMPYSNYPLRVGSSVLLYWIGYQGFFRYVVLKDRILLRRDINAATVIPKVPKEKTAPAPQKMEAEEQLYENANARILAQRLYMNPNLSLDVLAENLDLKPGKLSHLINTYSEYNFSDHINSFHIAAAKKLLTHPNFSRYTIISIGLECGFNSKSTFYTAFKKFTCMTPSAWRKNADSSE